MKVYIVDKSKLSIIRSMFHGYIFRRQDDKHGYVKCSPVQKTKIENLGIKLKEL